MNLVLREQELVVFEDSGDLEIEELVNLECLSLSHNRLINVFGLGQLTNLIELNLNYNQIREVHPLNKCV